MPLPPRAGIPGGREVLLRMDKTQGLVGSKGQVFGTVLMANNSCGSRPQLKLRSSPEVLHSEIQVWKGVYWVSFILRKETETQQTSLGDPVNTDKTSSDSSPKLDILSWKAC